MNFQYDEFYLDLQNEGRFIHFVPESQIIKTNPYPGLRPFKTSEWQLFKGREDLIEVLIDRLAASRFLSVIGSSGTGKSSLVRAGLIRAILGGYLVHESKPWNVAICRPGYDPIKNLGVALAFAKTKSRNQRNKEIDLPRIEEEYGHIESFLHNTNSRRGIINANEYLQTSQTEKPNLLIIVDQFEELFRFNVDKKIDGENLVAFFINLLIKSQEDPSIFVIITMRSEFLGACVRYQNFPEIINKGQYLLPQLNDAQLGEAIEEPLTMIGKSISPGLVNLLINETKTKRIKESLDQLPILQHALMRTYNIAKGSEITVEDYNNTGGMGVALSKHAKEIYKRLGPLEQSVAKLIFQGLTEAGGQNGGRRPVKLKILRELVVDLLGAEAGKPEVFDKVINNFRAVEVSFLMPPFNTALSDELILDISHESLARHWDELKEWIDEEGNSGKLYRMLQERRVQNDSKEDDEYLRGSLLFQLKEWRLNPKHKKTWALRYGTAEDYDKNIDFLNRSIDFARKRNKRELWNKVRVYCLAAVALIGVFLLMALVRSMDNSARNELKLTEGVWMNRLDTAHRLNLEERYVNANGVWTNLTSGKRRRKQADLLHSYKLLAEANMMLSVDPDLAINLVLYSTKLGNEDAREWLENFIKTRYHYERKFLVSDDVVGVEYFGKDIHAKKRSFNMITNQKYYTVPDGNGFINRAAIDTVCEVSPRLRYFGPDGNFLITFDPGRQEITRIERKTGKRTVFHPRNVQFDAIENIEICPSGQILVVIENSLRNKKQIKVLEFETGRLLQRQDLNELRIKRGNKDQPVGSRDKHQDRLRMLRDSITYIYFFDGNKGVALVSGSGIFVAKTTPPENQWKFIPSGGNIVSASKNETCRKHIFTTNELGGYNIYLADYDKIFDAPTFAEIEPRLKKGKKIINNATVSASGKFLAYFVQELKGRSKENIFLEIQNIQDTSVTTRISWPTYAPRFLKSDPEDDLFLTAGSPNLRDPKILDNAGIQPSGGGAMFSSMPNKLWYAYEWKATPEPVTVSWLSAAGNLRGFTINERIRYKMLNCEDSSKIGKREMLSCSKFYHSIYLSDSSFVFTKAKNCEHERDSLDDIRNLKASHRYFSRYFEKYPEISDDSFARFVQVSLLLDDFENQSGRNSYAYKTLKIAEGIYKNSGPGNKDIFYNALYNLRRQSSAIDPKDPVATTIFNNLGMKPDTR